MLTLTPYFLICYILFIMINYEFPSLLRSALFWDITQRRAVIPYRCFGTTYRSHLQELRNPRRELPLEVGTDWLSRNVGTQLPL
jgi:hypothetical protein